MPAIVMNRSGQWIRQELSDRPCWTLTAAAASGTDRLTITPAELKSLPSGALGLVAICSHEEAYFLPAAGAGTAYLNANPLPALPVQRLRDGDRITFHRAAGSPLRAWYANSLPAASSHTFTGQQPALCGYCRGQINPGDPVEGCAACGELLHDDCLIHGRGRCPRCGQAIATAAEPWTPPDFPISEEDNDEC